MFSIFSIRSAMHEYFLVWYPPKKMQNLFFFPILEGIWISFLHFFNKVFENITVF